jgi:hypothetical protein
MEYQCRESLYLAACAWPPSRLRLQTGKASPRNKATFLKGQCHKIFDFWFFSWISFPPAPEYLIRTVSNFFDINDIKNSWRYSQVKVHHRYQQHRWQICYRCQRQRRQILSPVSLVLLIPVAHLPLVSTIPAANLPLVVNDTAGKFATGVNDTVANNGNNIRLLRP